MERNKPDTGPVQQEVRRPVTTEVTGVPIQQVLRQIRRDRINGLNGRPSKKESPYLGR